MFDSIKRGFGFLGQAIDLARKDPDLVKPSLFGLAASALLVNVNLILAIVAAVLVVGPAIALITAFSSYVTTAYHTCLFIWARATERAMSTGQSMQTAAIPGPLAAVLGR